MVRRQLLRPRRPPGVLSPRRRPRCGGRRTRVLLSAVVLVGLAWGCTGSDRPSEAEWRRQWEVVVAEVPAPSEADDLDPDHCERLLVAARGARPDLEPAPTKALDPPVIRWLDLAEEVGFECADTQDLESVLVELQDLEGDIREGLDG